MRWQGLLGAVAPAAGVIALLELSRVPSAAHRGDPERLAAALVQLLRSAVRLFAAPALLLVLAALVLLWMERADGAAEPSRRAGGGTLRRAGAQRWALGLLFGLGVAQAVYAREVLIAYHPFSWNPAANAGFVAIGLGLGGLHVLFGSEALASRRRALDVLGGSLALLGLAVARAHYAVLVGQYPTLHECALGLSYVAVALGLGLVLAALDRSRARRAALGLGALVALLALLPLPSIAWARPTVMAYTELGRAAGVAEALARDRAHLLPTAMPSPRGSQSILRPDPHAAARFARRSGLPRLEASLRDLDVLVVLSDATRHDRTSLARPGGPTPRLAALAARGAHVFTRAYAPSNGTFPSVASMLAMTPVSFAELDVEARFWRGRLREERTTAVEAMRAAGRRTFWIGHDHEGCFSQNIEGLEQGFETRVLVPEARGEPADADVDARIADAAIERIARLRAAHERFFGLVFFVSPHDDYRARGGAGDDELARYDAELAYMDAQLGRVLDALEADGGLRDTLIVFAGDHGEAFGEHEERHHLGSMYDEQIHVPFVVWVPGERGARHDAPTSTAYLFPWLLSRGEGPEREAAARVLTEDVGPLMRALDGAVLSEVIGRRRQEAALVREEVSVVYDVLAELARVYDPIHDPLQQHDLREARADLYAPVTTLVRRYRRARFEGRRFRFLESRDEP